MTRTILSRLVPTLHLVALVLPLAPLAKGTYSIAACDPMTGACGVAVQTNNLAVGAGVPSARARVGALVSQFETNPAHGSLVLDLLERGAKPERALHEVLAVDRFEAQGSEARQVGVVALAGETAVHTGGLVKQAQWAGSRSGQGYSIQGNGLVGPQVAQAMEQAFLNTAGPLAERLLAALIAADAAGGQRTGRQSAALLIKTPQGWPLDIDLRIDHSANPVQDLQSLYAMHVSRQTLVDAERELRSGNFAGAAALAERGVLLAPHWPRSLLQASRVAVELGRTHLALKHLTQAFHAGPQWRDSEIGSGKYALLGHLRRFRRFVTPEIKAAALTRYQDRSQVSGIDAKLLGRILLEAGEPALARKVLSTANGDDAGSIVLLAIADEAEGNRRCALERIRRGRTAFPLDDSLRLSEIRLSR